MDSGFRSRRQSDAARAKADVQLFQIKGTTELNTRAVEVHTLIQAFKFDVFGIKNLIT